MATTTTINKPTTQKQVASNDIAAKTTVANAAQKNIFLNQSQINKITAGQSTNTTVVNPNKVSHKTPTLSSPVDGYGWLLSWVLTALAKAAYVNLERK